MRVALAETSILWEDKQYNYNELTKIISGITSEGKPDIVFFPEMSLTGFSMNTKVTGEADDSLLEKIGRLAAEAGICIGIGWVERTEAKAKNHYSIVGKNGSVLLDYVKIHPFSYGGEDRFFEGGEDICMCPVENFIISTAICYDLRFPELFQMMSDKADFIAVPANWPAGRAEHWQTLIRARAIENQCYVAGINCTGEMGAAEYAGGSMLVGPDGRMIEPENIYRQKASVVYIYSIENDVDNAREHFPTKRDRRKHIYNKYYI